MKKIIYFVPEFDSNNSAVLESQVLTQSKYVEALGYSVFFIGSYANGLLEKSEQTVEKYLKGYKLYNINNLNKKGFFGILKGVITITNNAVKEGYFDNVDYVYVRSLLGFLPILSIRTKKKFKLVYDFRGLVSDEQRLKKSNIIGQVESRIFQILELFVYKRADKVLAVSHALANYLQIQSGLHKEIIIVPCCSEFEDTVVTMTRGEIDIPETATIICYSGGISKWQRIDLVIDTAIAITTKNPNNYFMFLSKDIAEIRQRINAKNCQHLEKMRFYSLDSQDVVKYLALADIGLLLREDILTNRVASPIKAAEYMAAGLALAISPNIGDISNMAARENLGVILNDTDKLSIEEQLIAYIDTAYKTDQKKRIKEFAMDNFSWKKKSGHYRNLYT